MSVVQYPASSFYAATPQTSWYLGNVAWRSVPPDPHDRPYVLAPRHQWRPDLLAQELYGSGAYYWVFALRNPFLRADPIWLFTTGTTIMLPSANSVQRLTGS